MPSRRKVGNRAGDGENFGKAPRESRVDLHGCNYFVIRPRSLARDQKEMEFFADRVAVLDRAPARGYKRLPAIREPPRDQRMTTKNEPPLRLTRSNTDVMLASRVA